MHFGAVEFPALFAVARTRPAGHGADGDDRRPASSRPGSSAPASVGRGRARRAPGRPTGPHDGARRRPRPSASSSIATSPAAPSTCRSSGRRRRCRWARRCSPSRPGPADLAGRRPPRVRRPLRRPAPYASTSRPRAIGGQRVDGRHGQPRRRRWRRPSRSRPSSGGRSSSRSGRTSTREAATGTGRLESEPAAMTERLGRADLHIHTLASDGTAGVVEILEHVETNLELDVIAITDHERIDAALAARTIALDRGYRVEVVVGEEVTTLGGHLLALWIEQTDPAVPLAAHHDRRDPRAGRPRDPGPSARALPAVRPGLRAPPAPRRRAALPPRRHRGLQPDDARPAVARPGRPLRRRARPRQGRQLRRPRPRGDRLGYTTFPGRTADDLRAAILARTTHHHGTFHRTTPSSGRSRRQLRKYGRDARANLGGRLRGDGSRRDLGYPRRRADRHVKIGLVTPYVYPLPGGVNQHVRYLYENLRLRGHDVRILTSSPRPPAVVGGRRHPDRQGLLDAGQRLGRHGHALAALPVPGRATVLDREQFDLLHFHEPFVPFLSLVVLRLSTSVNVATFHAYGGFSPAYEFGLEGHGLVRRAPPRPDRGLGRGAALHRPLLPGRLQGHPERRRHRPLPPAPCPIARWQDGTRNILFVGRFESRKGLLDLLKAYRILRKTGCQCRLLVVGGGPQEREARRYVMTRASAAWSSSGRVSRRGARRAVQDGRRLLLAGDRPRIVRDRAPRGDGRRDGDRLQRHPRLQGRRPPRTARRCSCRPASRRRSPARSAGPRRDDAAPRGDGRVRPPARPGVQLGAGDRARSRTTTAS